MKAEKYSISTLVGVGNDAFKDGKKAGHKEVVEWTDNTSEFYRCPLCGTDYILTKKRWEAQKKEWGL